MSDNRLVVAGDAEVIVRWSDSEGPKEVVFPGDLPWSIRAAILTMGNDDWGQIFIQNPDEPEFLWCSAGPRDRAIARLAVANLRGTP